MDTEQKLNILADSSKYDLSCACKFKDEPGRTRGAEGRWIYPAVLPDGRKVFLLKTLQSNACVNDCSYCPFNQSRDLRRCTISPDDMAETFMKLYQARRVSGLFLSSGVNSSADRTMAGMLGTVELLRKRYQFKGFIHLKVIPGASAGAIEQAVRLATRVSVNIEAPNADRLEKLTSKKRFHRDIISAMRTISELRGARGKAAKQTSQFVVGAAGETDKEIVLATDLLYEKFRLERVYFSAYQNFELPAEARQENLFAEMPEKKTRSVDEIFIREHRLYQVDFLLRRYGFGREDIYFDKNGRLSLENDPKMVWAQNHPEFFPVDPNRAERFELLRVPGIGPIGASRIIRARRVKKIQTPEELRLLGVRGTTAAGFLKLAGMKLF